MIEDIKLDDDEGRIRALERLNLLDTPAEAPFENIVNLLQQTLNVPICAISLIDRHRQWFKARRGLETDETDRKYSLCTHTILKNGPLIVRDTLEDPLFRNNPCVTGEPFVRGYAGIPLKISEGYQVGSLCVVDTKPREFPVSEIALLQEFAQAVLSEIELRQIAATDDLTKALSRRGWYECANAQFQLAKQDKSPLSLALLDIDHFRKINNRFGHWAGDTVLVALAEACMETMREDDFFGRIGGEEFAVLFPETEAATARHVMETLRIAFEKMEHDLGEVIRSTISIGVTELKTGDTDIGMLVRRADFGLSEAKRTGRNQIVMATRSHWHGEQGLVA